MSSNEYTLIKKAVDDFLLINKDRYYCLISFEEQLKNIDENSFQETIDFIENNKKTFFNDHQRAILFFYIINHFSSLLFQKLEIISDVAIHFEKELKNREIGMTDFELFDICRVFNLNIINYFFSKGFFSIDLIYKHSIINSIIFINFLPELEQYDPEYVYIKEKKINKENERIVSFYNIVKSDYKKHILNRNNNYHPSLLHKAIRDDDIESFQSIISKNNIKLDEPIIFSFYERSHTFEDDMKPIKLAAIYKSIKIFKFLLMNDVIIDENLLDYALYGSDADIIHLCEKVSSGKYACLQSIYSHNNELLEYSIENYNNNIEENEIISNALQNFEKQKENDGNDDFYDNNNKLNVENMINAIESYNYPIINSCLDKFVFIAQNNELFNQNNAFNYTILFYIKFDFEILKFIYSQMKQAHSVYYLECLKKCLDKCIEFRANDASKFLYLKLKYVISHSEVLKKSIRFNHVIANFLLDMQIEEKKVNNNNINFIYNRTRLEIHFKDLLLAIECYNEDIVIKMIHLFDLLNNKRNYKAFVDNLIDRISPLMIYSLFEKLSKFVTRDILFQISKIFNEYGYQSIAKYIKGTVTFKK